MSKNKLKEELAVEDYKNPTRRQTLKAITSAGAAGMTVPGAAAAQSTGSGKAHNPQISAEFLEAKSELPAKWWEKDSAEISTNTSENVVLVKEGVDHWVSTDENAPDWFTINDRDQFEYKPHGVYNLADAGLCIGWTWKVGPFEIGGELCHYGGCEWELKLCYGGCIGTGRKNNCDSIYTMGADLGVVDGNVTINPHLGLNRDNRFDLSGKLCYYYIFDSGCKTMDKTIDI